ncbi:MAG: hypothetical protein HYZ68_00140 [Chloroflexi bacterium]|nr:hypothetical protein [Chloroflexota bacterium]
MPTPMRKQYLSIKKRYPEAIVFFRLGDFYETFDQDAKLVAQICDIVLTSRPVAKGQRVPMAGVPYHAAEGYIAKLITAGHKVAIVEQMGEAESASGGPRGLMARQVVRVLTPGTLVEPGLLEAKRNNYLAAVVARGEEIGLAYVDITTGEFAVTQFGGADAPHQLQQELARLQPAECLVPMEAPPPVEKLDGFHLSPYPAWRFEPEQARQALLDHFQVASLEGFGCQDKPLAIGAAGSIIQYLGETQPSSLAQLDGLRTYSTSAFMTLDPATRRNLELTQTIRGGAVSSSLLGVLDVTQTPMGGRLLRQWLSQPLLELEALNRRLDAVEALYRQGPLRIDMRERLGKLRDLERTVRRVAQRMAGPRDLWAMRDTLERTRELRELLVKAIQDQVSPLSDLVAELDPCEEVAQLIARAIREDAAASLGEVGVQQNLRILHRGQRAQFAAGPLGLLAQADHRRGRTFYHPGDEALRGYDPQRGTTASGPGNATFLRGVRGDLRLRRAPAGHGPSPGPAGCLLRPGRGGGAQPLRPPSTR